MRSIPSDPVLPVIAVSLLVAATLSGCGVTDVERDTNAPIQTDRLEYTLRPSDDGRALETEIAYAYENRTNAAICMTHCNGHFSIALEKRRGDDWEAVWSPAIPECLTRPPITIDPGETYRDTLAVTHATPADAGPKIRAAELEGVYRIAIPAVSRLSSPDACGGPQVPERERISNRFVLRRP